MKNIPKKYLIAIGIVVVVIIGVVFFVFNPFKKPLDSATATARRGASELLSVTIMVDLLNYYNVETNKLAFSQSPEAKKQIDADISNIKAKYGGDYDYKIFETSEIGLSVKTVEKTSDSYYCVDTNKHSKAPVEIKKEQFTLDTNCDGNAFN
jgi:hypothetical protein